MRLIICECVQPTMMRQSHLSILISHMRMKAGIPLFLVPHVTSIVSLLTVMLQWLFTIFLLLRFGIKDNFRKKEMFSFNRNISSAVVFKLAFAHSSE